jgi:hypothetical protein
VGLLLSGNRPKWECAKVGTAQVGMALVGVDISWNWTKWERA